MTTRAKSKSSRSRRDPLKEYKAKRDFGRTSEPKAKRGRDTGWQFVVQKHDARRTHYDLRLELGGTLKSWAVTKGPSMIVGEKRLAVRTEDHPMAYLDFEGNIPKGEYGGGAMIVWDRGTWTAGADPEKGLLKGHLDIVLDGARLKGRWHLVRMRARPGEKKEQWLLMKATDEFGRTAGQPDVTDEEATSFVSGLTTQELAAKGTLRSDHAGRQKVIATRKGALPNVQKVKGARKGILPAFVEPSLPQLSDKAPSGSNWVHEIKYDGYRMQARIDGRNVRLLTRKGLDWTKRFPNISAALKESRLSSALIDGEIVVEDAAGIPSFNFLQADLKSDRTDRFRYFVFDLLYCEGFDLTKATQLERKALLQSIVRTLPDHSPIRFSEHLEQDGPTMFEHACRLGLEGIVSKRSDLPYRSGRGDHWLKTKGMLRQEFLILGYVSSTATAKTVGSLLLGYFENGKLFYAGRVGTGFSAAEAKSLRTELEAIATTKLALENRLPAGAEKGVHWTKPELVCEIEYRGWTTDEFVRQASYKGIRQDRPPTEVSLEVKPQTSKVKGKRTAKQPSANVDTTRLTHPERLLWPEAGITKQGLADFYTEIAEHILPHIAGRALSLVRCPSGVNAKCFYAKHAWEGMSNAVRRVDVGKNEAMLSVDTVAGLIELVQAGVVEIHPWGSELNHLESPDRLIFDLDPGDGVPWQAVIDAAIEVRDRLNDRGLTSFVKTSGGKGLHVVLPIKPTVNWRDAKKFTARIAEAMAKDSPGRYVATMSKSARHGRIFIDYFRNDRGSTAVAAYSTRSLPQAPVSTPLAWNELTENIRADHFTVDNIHHRLNVQKQDPWVNMFSANQQILNLD